jgi:hypothetical protein
MVRRWPVAMRDGSSMPLTLAIAATVVSYWPAICVRLSPAFTVCTVLLLFAGALAVVSGAAVADSVWPPPGTTNRWPVRMREGSSMPFTSARRVTLTP